MSEKITVTVKGSTGSLYPVEFSVHGDSVRVFCHCPAGITQQMCKHKAALIGGNVSILANEAEAKLIEEMRAWPEYAQLIARLAKYETELSLVQGEIAKLSLREKSIKTQMGRDLTAGGYS
jgi:uncharacterized Zn finger protein